MEEGGLRLHLHLCTGNSLDCMTPLIGPDDEWGERGVREMDG